MESQTDVPRRRDRQMCQKDERETNRGIDRQTAEIERQTCQKTDQTDRLMTERRDK